MALDNDVRGWILTCLSGIACVCGASIIYVDLLAQTIPRFRHFEISGSDTFLSASLSLSFGVMLFSALYSMLPSAKSYLTAGTLSPAAASYALVALFLGGAVGIQIISRLLHHFIPSHIVDCDHTHGDEESLGVPNKVGQPRHTPNRGPLQDKPRSILDTRHVDPEEETPLLARNPSLDRARGEDVGVAGDSVREPSSNGEAKALGSQRPLVLPRTISNTIAKMTATGTPCDETGPCKGFSDPCGQECFRSANRRGSEMRGASVSRGGSTFQRSSSTRAGPDPSSHAAITAGGDVTSPTHAAAAETTSRNLAYGCRASIHQFHHLTHQHPDHGKRDDATTECGGSVRSEARVEHHHHVPTNAFLSIGLQTSLAIALHKAPEGFITYATNHANPQLGFAIFMALFIHNITEGFAMALPLYLALQSRTKAIIWSSLLGGLSQPLGAGVAAVWFRVARGSTGFAKPTEDVYGCMFAVTAGVMASVALQLFSESLGLSHNKNMCIGFAFLGMGILGISSALTA